MAKLGARGRRVWVHAERVEVNPSWTLTVARRWMSDGIVLQTWRVAGKLQQWKVFGRWDRVKVSIPDLREELLQDGWKVDGEWKPAPAGTVIDATRKS